MKDWVFALHDVSPGSLALAGLGVLWAVALLALFVSIGRDIARQRRRNAEVSRRSDGAEGGGL